MINDKIIKEYDYAYKRKQWYGIWRFMAVAHYKWLEPYLQEMHKRGAYPICHYQLANFYTEPQDIIIASFIAANAIQDDENVIRSIEYLHGVIGNSPYKSFKNREFVHWRNQSLAVFLDALYRIERNYDSLEEAIMAGMRFASDPAEALYTLLRREGVAMSMNRCRSLIIRLATEGGIGLGVWKTFAPNIIMPPEDELTKWYVKGMFPADTDFPFDELVCIMSDTPYRVIYDAMMMRLMAQANEPLIRKYFWHVNHTFYSMPAPPIKVMGNYNSQQYIEYVAPVYDFSTRTLVVNPRFKGSGTWMAYEDFVKTDKGKAYLEKKRRK